MLTKSDIADAIFERLRRGSSAGVSLTAGQTGAAQAPGPLPSRVFISDRDLRRMVGEGQKRVKVPSGAIISPLSEDWLDYNGIEIIRG